MSFILALENIIMKLKKERNFNKKQNLIKNWIALSEHGGILQWKSNNIYIIENNLKTIKLNSPFIQFNTIQNIEFKKLYKKITPCNLFNKK